MSDKHGPDPDPDTGAVLGGLLSPQGAGARSCGTWEVTSASTAPTETTVTVPIPIGPTCPKCGGEMAVQKIEHPGGWVCLRCNPPPAGPQVSEAEIIEVAAWLTGKEQVTGAEALLAIEAGWGRLLGQRDGAQRLAEEREELASRWGAQVRELEAEAQRLREAVRRYLLAPLGRPVAEAWVALAMALDVLDGRTPPGSYVTDRAITTENDRWITYAVAAMSRLRRALDDRTQPTTVKILIWQHGPCAIEAWSNLGTERGWLRREARYGEGADPDRAIEAWEQAEWHTGLEVCGSHECQERARRLAWARRRLAELTAGHGQTCPDGHADTCDRCRVARELRDAAGCCPDEIDIYGRAAKAEELLRRLLDLHLPLVPAKKRRYQEDENGWSMLLHGTVLEADRLLLRDQPDLCELCEGLGVFIDGDGDECCCPNCEGGGVVI